MLLIAPISPFTVKWISSTFEQRLWFILLASYSPHPFLQWAIRRISNQHVIWLGGLLIDCSVFLIRIGIKTIFPYIRIRLEPLNYADVLQKWNKKDQRWWRERRGCRLYSRSRRWTTRIRLWGAPPTTRRISFDSLAASSSRLDNFLLGFNMDKMWCQNNIVVTWIFPR